MHDYEHVLWIGGGDCAGKTSITKSLAERFDVQTYSYDWHDARDHSERVDPTRHPSLSAWLAMSQDERWVLTSPTEMMRNEFESACERFEMVTEDLLARPNEAPIVAEGYGLLPELVAPLLSSDRNAIWLLPTPEFRERALAMRGWATPEQTSDPARTRENRLKRDELLTERIRGSAQRLRLATFNVDGAKTLDEVTAHVERHFSAALAGRARQQDSARDAELRASIQNSLNRFLAACTRGHSVLEHVAARFDVEPYRLGLMHSAYTTVGRARVTELAMRRSFKAGAQSRFGAEHWAPLVASGFAVVDADGWLLTERARAAVLELYVQIRAEVRQRSAPPALAGRVGEVLERLSYLVPLSTRAAFIRELWGDNTGTTLERLYRAAWELWILPEPTSYGQLWPRGIVLEALERDLNSLIESVER